MKSDFSNYLDTLENLNPKKNSGKIKEVIGLIIESNGPTSSIGEVCNIMNGKKDPIKAEVVGFRGSTTLLMALGDLTGIKPGMEVVSTGKALTIGVGEGLIGRVIDGLGNPLDGKGPLNFKQEYSVFNTPPNPLERKRITETMPTGIRSIDAFSTLGRGQRVGIFAGSGVGKSVTMGMIARNCYADINVIALIGERGREVKEFIEKDLGEEGLKRSIVVVATSDQAALVRVKASLIATTIAEYFRDLGKDVMLLLDSSTRIAMAQREIGLAIGEPPATKGYTPSVFALLPKLLERAGTSNKGTITGIYTVLVEGDDMDEPIADSMRSILDGHIVLSRAIAHKNHYPAVDVLASVSRCMGDVVDANHKEASGKILALMAAYKETEDMINIGAYARGSNPEVDRAISIMPALNTLLRQGIEEKTDFVDIVASLNVLTGNRQ